MARSVRILALLPLLGLAVAARADYPYLEAFQGLYVGNGDNGAFTGIDGHGGANTAADPYVAHQTFTGLDSLGVQQTMTVDGRAYSSAEYGKIHISAGGTVTNPYYNAANAPYYDGTGDPNPNGSPDQIAVHGNAGWGDKATYTGFQGTGYKVNYYFRLEGSTFGDTQAGLNFYTSAHSDDGFGYNPRTSQGNELWITPKYDVQWGVPTTVDVDFFAGLTTYVSQRAEGAPIVGTADYENTLTLMGAVVTDPNGNVVNGWTATTASGVGYIHPLATPEPTDLAALGLGALALVRRRGSRRRA